MYFSICPFFLCMLTNSTTSHHDALDTHGVAEAITVTNKCESIGHPDKE